MLMSGGSVSLATSESNDLVVEIHQKKTRLRQIIAVEKLSTWRSRSPKHDLAFLAGFGFVHFAKQRGNDVRCV